MQSPAGREHARCAEMALKHVADLMNAKGSGLVTMTLIDFESIKAWSELAQAHFAAATYYDNNL